MLRLAIVALPVWLGVSLFVWSARGDAGVLAGLALGFGVAVAAFLLGRVALASQLPLTLRIGVAALFAIPAAMAGFSVVSGLMVLGGASLIATDVVAGLGAAAIGLAALARLAVPSEPISPASKGDGAALSR